MNTLHLSDLEHRRFWSKVALPDENGCMLWISSLEHGNYGAFRLNGKKAWAHRISLVQASGPPPLGKPEAAHSCRNRHCVAPEHLRWASTAENERDKVRDGTHNRGERQGSAKLTAGDVAEIRRLYAAGGVSQRELGLRYGVHQTNISSIIQGRSWNYYTSIADQCSKGA